MTTQATSTNWAVDKEDKRHAVLALKKLKERRPQMKAHRVNNTTHILLPANSTPEYIAQRIEIYKKRMKI